MNVVFIMTDRHNAEFAGCYGNPITRTPNLDAIASRGTLFTAAYSLSPICAPTRAAMISGRYPHEIGVWDNTTAYSGIPQGWGHFFRERGVLITSLGKMDFEPESDSGIEENEQLAEPRALLDINALYRENEVHARLDLFHRHRATGPADSSEAYAKDARIAQVAASWLRDERPNDRPWILVVNFNNMHRPWRPPRELWDHYDSRVSIDTLDQRFVEDRESLHPYHRAYGRHHAGELLSLEESRRAVVGYHATCEMMDRHVGVVLNALDEASLRDTTLIAYSADHGGSCGEHRNFDHGSMYDESIRVPLMFSGPEIREGAVITEPVSALDLYPTFCEAVGLEKPTQMRGASLWDLLSGGSAIPPSDFTLTEYHASGFPASVFAIRSGQYKLVECVGERPMLFNLQEDPLEMRDLVVETPDDPVVEQTVRRLRQMLSSVCSPEAVDARAKSDQRRRRAELERSGKLQEELEARGFEPRTDRLVYREDFGP